MVEINIKEIGNIIPIVDEKIKNYNDSNIELMNIIKSTQNHWKGNEYDYYIGKLNKENSILSRKIDILTKKINVYKYIYNEYKSYGNKLAIEVDSKEKILTKINNCISKEKEIEEKLNLLINNLTDEIVKDKLNKKLSLLINVNREYNAIYKDIKRLYEKVRNNESKIATKLEEIELENLEI